MLFLIAVLLAIFVLPSPWGLVAMAVGGTIDLAETGVFMWWSKRSRAAVGVDSLLGRTGIAVGALGPVGQVKVGGEIWNARCAERCEPGALVVVRAVHGLTLDVERL